MCLYPKLIINRKYIPTKKNNYNPPKCNDERVKYVPIACGNCIECRKQKARQWQVRMHEEMKNGVPGYFVTMSFAPEELQKLITELDIKESNAVVTIAVRRFLERWRKKYKTSCKHWLITELGHNNTERIHLHGIIWTNKNMSCLEDIWKYGNVYIGKYCNAKTINYIIKYVTKIDTTHKNYRSIILCSAGIGGNYKTRNHEKGHEERTGARGGKKATTAIPKDYYILPNGQRINMPIYYRNFLFSEEEREKLWIEKIEQETRYIRGIKHSTKTEAEYKKYLEVLKVAQEDNIKLGYGSDAKEWRKETYNITMRMLRSYSSYDKKLLRKYRTNSGTRIES